MWELDYKESWALKNWCFWTVVLEKTLESPLDCKEIQPVHSKGDQSWTFIGRTDAEAETPILWSRDAKSWLIGKDPDAGKDWRPEEKGSTEDEMAGWHHHLDGHEFEQALGIGHGQGGLVCCSPWGHKESDTTEQLNWTELKYPSFYLPTYDIYLCLSFYLPTYLLYLSLHLPTCLSHLSMDLPTYLWHLSISVSFYLPTYDIYLSMCLSIYLLTYLSRLCIYGWMDRLHGQREKIGK